MVVRCAELKELIILRRWPEWWCGQTDGGIRYSVCRPV